MIRRLAFIIGLGLATAVPLPACDGAALGARDNDGLSLSAGESGAGWYLAIVGFRGRPTRLEVRFGDDRTETYRTPAFELPSDIQGPIDIWLLEYEMDGRVHPGPFRFRFDPAASRLTAAKDAFDQLRTRWVSWRRYAGKDTLQLSFLNMHACAIERVEYGFGDEPDTVHTLPACDGNHASLYSDLTFAIDEKTHVVLQVTFVDDTQTSVQRFPNPNYRSGTAGDGPPNQIFVHPGPDDVRVYLDDAHQCDSPCAIDVPLDGREHEIRLEKDGYQDLVRTWKPTGLLDDPGELGPMVPLDPPAPPEPTPEPSAKPPTPPEPTPEPEPTEATTYAQAARTLEPCWRMLFDDLPIRSAQPCRQAYDRALPIAAADGGHLANVFNDAADVGEAWNDADTALLAIPPPNPTRRRQLQQAKRRARQRERKLLPQRTTALATFAHHKLDELQTQSPCDAKQRLLLHALEALPPEFDVVATQSTPDLTNLAAATVHARTTWRRTNEACEDRPDTAQFRAHADAMIKDALEVVIARRRQSRCTKGELHEVCARKGGLGPHRRALLRAAIRGRGR